MDADASQNPEQEPLLTPADLMARLHDAERQLAGLRAELAAHDGLVTAGLLSAITAHELRNALTPMMTYAQHAQAHPEDADLARRAFDRITAGLHHAARIIDATFEVAGNHAPDTNADLRGSIDHALELLIRSPEKDGVTIENAVQAGFNLAISAAALQQIIINLSMNAVAAMTRSAMNPGAGAGAGAVGGEGSETNRSGPMLRHGGMLRFSVRHVGGGMAELVIADTGPGLPDMIRERLFQPFTTSDPAAGTGLGLLICRRLAEQHGGSMSIDSSPGRGTSVIIRLPLRAKRLHRAG